MKLAVFTNEEENGLNMEMLSGGLNYYTPNNLKFGILEL